MSRSNRREFRPAAVEPLEDRVVLSHVGLRPRSVLLSGLAPRFRAIGKHRQPPILALVNKAFDSFVQDYTQARATYLSSGSGDTASSSAFENYTRYRVNLLGQQLISTGLQSTAKASRHHQGDSSLTLPLLINKRITGLGTSGVNFKPGTLGQALTSSIPTAGGSATAIALNSLAQDQAIETTRVNVLNGFSVIKNGNSSSKNS